MDEPDPSSYQGSLIDLFANEDLPQVPNPTARLGIFPTPEPRDDEDDEYESQKLPEAPNMTPTYLSESDEEDEACVAVTALDKPKFSPNEKGDGDMIDDDGLRIDEDEEDLEPFEEASSTGGPDAGPGSDQQLSNADENLAGVIIASIKNMHVSKVTDTDTVADAKAGLESKVDVGLMQRPPKVEPLELEESRNVTSQFTFDLYETGDGGTYVRGYQRAGISPMRGLFDFHLEPKESQDANENGKAETDAELLPEDELQISESEPVKLPETTREEEVIPFFGVSPQGQKKDLPAPSKHRPVNKLKIKNPKILDPGPKGMDLHRSGQVDAEPKEPAPVEPSTTEEDEEDAISITSMGELGQYLSSKSEPRPRPSATLKVPRKQPKKKKSKKHSKKDKTKKSDGGQTLEESQPNDADSAIPPPPGQGQRHRRGRRPKKNGTLTLDEIKRAFAERNERAGSTDAVKKHLADLELRRLPPDGGPPPRFWYNELVEAIDKRDCGYIRHATVDLIYGNRLRVRYLGEGEDSGFWFDQRSDLIHPAGWARAVSVQLAYCAVPHWRWPRPAETEFPPYPKDLKLRTNMVFEIRHPVLPHKICAGFVAEIYKEGYFLAQTDWTRPEELVEIVLHVTSDYLLPINFCKDHGIEWEPPVSNQKSIRGRKKFDWETFIRMDCVESVPLDFSEINRRKKPNQFKLGDEVEASRVVDPQRVSKARVVQVAGNLIKVEFDKPEPENGAVIQQWMSCRCSNLYERGYRKRVRREFRAQRKTREEDDEDEDADDEST